MTAMNALEWIKSADRLQRLQAARELGESGKVSKEIIDTLIHAVRDPDFAVAGEACRSLSLLGDRTIIPRLIEERSAAIAELKREGHVFHERDGDREMGLTIALICLSTEEECRELAKHGNAFERHFIARKLQGASTGELWGPLTS
jgi:hypothetical protein